MAAWSYLPPTLPGKEKGTETGMGRDREEIGGEGKRREGRDGKEEEVGGEGDGRERRQEGEGGMGKREGTGRERGGNRNRGEESVNYS